MLGRVRSAPVREVVEIVEAEDVAEERQFAPHRVDLRQLLVVLDEHADRVGVVEDIAAVFGGRFA